MGNLKQSPRAFETKHAALDDGETFADGLPRSVRNQSPEMRAAIRRRQSTECARRKREKDAAQRDYMERKYAENQSRIDVLERKIEMLSAELVGGR